jgi:hypothetical protein
VAARKIRLAISPRLAAMIFPGFDGLVGMMSLLEVDGDQWNLIGFSDTNLGRRDDGEGILQIPFVTIQNNL